MFLKKRVAEENILMGSDIAPLAMLDAEDLEEIEGYSEGDFIQFYFEWLSSGKYSQFSLRDYLKRFYPAINMRSHWLDSISKQIFNEATQLFFGKPLSVSGDDFR
jgi:hypothetical protein